MPIGCPFHAVTGLDCPGCGLVRGTVDLLSGDLAGALDRNPLIVVLVPMLTVGLVVWALRLMGHEVRLPRVPTAVGATALALVVAFGIARNLPVDALAWMAADR
ncbi:MAG TPA: DUF2752 domain-containing protein [Acidimicrobiales bacterium]|nr:DUF2752 domain-containing protein [Acidimicrobiales bacterium]